MCQLHFNVQNWGAWSLTLPDLWPYRRCWTNRGIYACSGQGIKSSGIQKWARSSLDTINALWYFNRAVENDPSIDMIYIYIYMCIYIYISHLLLEHGDFPSREIARGYSDLESKWRDEGYSSQMGEGSQKLYPYWLPRPFWHRCVSSFHMVFAGWTSFFPHVFLFNSRFLPLESTLNVFLLIELSQIPCIPSFCWLKIDSKSNYMFLSNLHLCLAAGIPDVLPLNHPRPLVGPKPPLSPWLASCDEACWRCLGDDGLNCGWNLDLTNETVISWVQQA